MLSIVNQILTKLKNLVNDSITTGILVTKQFGLGSTTDGIYRCIINSPKILLTNFNNAVKSISLQFDKKSNTESSLLNFSTDLNIKYQLGHDSNNNFILNVLDSSGNVLNSITIDGTTFNSTLKMKHNNVDIATLNDITGIAHNIFEIPVTLPTVSGLYIFKVEPLQALPAGLNINDLVQLTDEGTWLLKAAFKDLPALMYCKNQVYIKTNNTFTSLNYSSNILNIGSILIKSDLTVDEDFIALNGQKISKLEYNDLWVYATKNNLTTKDARYSTKFIDINETTFSVPNFSNTSLRCLDYAQPNQILSVKDIKYSTGSEISSTVGLNLVIKAKNTIYNKNIIQGYGTYISSSKYDSSLLVNSKVSTDTPYSIKHSSTLILNKEILSISTPIIGIYLNGMIETIPSINLNISKLDSTKTYYLIKEQYKEVYLTELKPIEDFNIPVEPLEGQLFLNMNTLECLKYSAGKWVVASFIKLGQFNTSDYFLYNSNNTLKVELNYIGSILTMKHNLSIHPKFINVHDIKYRNVNMEYSTVLNYNISISNSSIALDLSNSNVPLNSIIYLALKGVIL